MKQVSCLLLLVFFVTFSNAHAQKETAEQTAIRKVIEAETRTYFERNWDKWADGFVHDSTVTLLYIGPSGYTKVTGWNNVAAMMKSGFQQPALSAEAMAPYLKKFDYRYTINGNMALVSFREGQTAKDAAEESRVLVKQNGTWKIAALNVVFAGQYNLRNTFNQLKALAGKWKMDVASFKAEPAMSGSTYQSVSVDAQETASGFELVTHAVMNTGGQFTTNMEHEQFIPDYSENVIRYVDVYKNSTGQTSTNFGKAEIRDDGSIMVTILDKNKPDVKSGEVVYNLQKDGTLQGKSQWFGADGKVQNMYTFTMQRQ